MNAAVKSRLEGFVGGYQAGMAEAYRRAAQLIDEAIVAVEMPRDTRIALELFADKFRKAASMEEHEINDQA